MNDFDLKIALYERIIRYQDPNACWPWIMYTDEYGYGLFNIKGRCVYAHREIYRLEIGPPNGIVRHTCDNPPCCRPSHLILGTHADNVADRVARGRSAVGLKNGRALIDFETAMLIKAEFATGQYQQKDLAVKYGVDRKTIYNVLNDKLSILQG